MPQFKEGDWYCENCNDHQFAKNTFCRLCNTPRPKNVKGSNKNFRQKSILKPGDWLCSVCNGHQFASRSICRDCGTPKNGVPKNTKKDNKQFYMVIDFEANCSSEFHRDHEIIEFPAVLVNSKTGETVSEFRKFVKLVNHNNLSDFIKNLTHITDEDVNNGLDWKVCLVEFEKWCHDNNVTDRNTTVVTCGNWDIQSMLTRQLHITKTNQSPFLKKLFSCWNNVKTSYAISTQKSPTGMDRMLQELNLDLVGHHHSGIDDCRNIARICHELTKLGHDMTTPNKFIE